MPCTSGNLDFHSQIVVDSSHESYFDQSILPTHGLTVDPISFDFEPMGEAFLCMNMMNLETTFIITKEDGSPAQDPIAFVNNALMSMFERIDTYLNDVQINAASSSAIPYQSYIENLLSFDDLEDTVVKTRGFFKDQASRFDIVTVDTDEVNSGFVSRTLAGALSRKVRVSGSIYSNFLRSDCHLAPGNKLSLVFHRSNPDFFICGEQSVERYKFEILDMKIHVRRIQLEQNIPKQILSPTKPQRYISSYTEIQEFQAKDVRQFKATLRRESILPKQVIVVSTSLAARSGTHALNPFNFTHADLRRIHLVHNDVRRPVDSFNPDFVRGVYAREYFNLLRSSGRVNSGRTLPFTMEEFAGGYFFTMFDLTEDECNSRHLHIGKIGNLELEMEWGHALDYGRTIIVMSIFDQVVEIDPISKIPTVSIF